MGPYDRGELFDGILVFKNFRQLATDHPFLHLVSAPADLGDFAYCLIRGLRARFIPTKVIIQGFPSRCVNGRRTITTVARLYCPDQFRDLFQIFGIGERVILSLLMRSVSSSDILS